MAEQVKAQDIAQYKERVSENVKKVEKPAEQLKSGLDKLAGSGGFDLLEMAFAGVENMNPERKARKRIFLSESAYKGDRDKLKKTLQLWAAVLGSTESISEMVEASDKNIQVASDTFKTNMSKAIEETKDLEKSYRSVALFYKNTESAKLKNVSVMNADLEQLKDLDDTRFIDAVREELVNNYDRLDLRDNYGILIVPGYLGSNKVVEKWAKIAHENKVMLVTDFEHLDNPDDVMDMFEMANLAGGDMYRSNVMIACKWLIGRDKFDEICEEE